MTRSEFIDEINDWWELIDFCSDNGCSYCDDVYSDDARDDFINECLVDMARNANNWSSLLDTLNEITTGYDYYVHTDYGEWNGLDDGDFIGYKNDVLEWADNQDIWDDDEEEPPTPVSNDIDEEDDDFIVADELISIDELIGACRSQLQQIGNDNKETIDIDEEAFEIFVTSCVTIMEEE